MKFWFKSAFFFLVHLCCYAVEWPVPKSIKCLSSGAFHCKENGQFENPFDVTCSSYFICEGTADELMEIYRTCPNNTLYNPITQECSANYKCICDEDNDSTIVSNTTSTTSESATTFTYPNEFTTQHSTETNFHDTITASKPCSIGENLTCTEAGRLDDANNTSCVSYFDCYHLSDDQPKKYVYKCYGISSENSSCDYTCPCSEKSSNTASVTSEPSTTKTLEDTNSTLSKYCDGGGNFTCTKTGYYANPNDTNCKSYYYCYLWPDGRVRPYSYNCPVGLFNPHKDSCDETYVCPCSQESTKYVTQVTSTTTVSPTTIKPSTPTVLPETQKYCSIGGNFTCTKTGRFANPNDPSCNSYLYCYIWSDGKVRQYSYNCSIGLFNPSKESCDPSYVCPCSKETTETSKLTSTSTSVAPSSTSTTIITSDASTPSTTLPKYCAIGGNFTCSETGRFANPNDTTCKSYFYCYGWSNGAIGQYSYTCSIGLFNPTKESCDPSYVCPCAEETTTGASTLTSTSTSVAPSSTPTPTKSDATTTAKYCAVGGNFTCSKTGRFADPNDTTCKSYFYCYGWSNGAIGQYAYTCSIGLFNPTKESCDPSYVCPCVEETTTGASTLTSTTTSVAPSSTPTPTMSDATATAKYCAVGGNFTCSETGRFANPNDTTCKSYFYCYGWSNGAIGQYSYTCSIGLFNPTKESCDPSYVCPCAEEITTGAPTLTSTTTSVAPSSTPTPTISDATATTKYCAVGGNFTCSEAGRFANPNDTTCKSYFYCYGWSNGAIGQYSYTCSIGLFNPTKESCDPSYACPCTEETTSGASTLISTSTSVAPSDTVTLTTSDASTISTTTPKYCAVGGNFTCSETGRFADPNDTTCKSYFYCYGWSNGAIGQYSYTCSIGLFNPTKESCDPSYVCPCTEETTTGASTLISTSTSVAPSDTVTLTTSDASTINTTTPKYCAVGGNFTCSQTGRFADPNDTTCKSYFYCYGWSNGAIGQYSYTCSIGLFNPTKESCDPSYVCPCTEGTTTGASTLISTSSSVAPSDIVTQTTSDASTISTTTPMYCDVGGSFTCSETGRFADPNDTTCKSYFYCYGWSNGAIGQYSYTCSIGLFNPTKESCDPSYVCPCTEETTTGASTLISTSTSVTPTDTVTQTTSDASTISTTTPKYCAVGGNFTCSETGRFADPNDTTCKSYFYCYGWSNGAIGQYSYTCSVGLFNPFKESCDPSYVCPCAEETTTGASTLTSTSTSVAHSSTPITTTSEDHTISTIEPEYCAVGGNFTCFETGRFANPNDATCKTYFYCYAWSRGEIGKYSYTCSIGLFNPTRGSCDPLYLCPCAKATTTSTSTLTSTSTSVAPSSTPTTTTSDTSTISTTTPKYCAVGGNFTCSETGRFANPDDATCKSYFYCYGWSSGEIGQYSYTCSIGLFNPHKESCDPAYVCPCKE